MAAPKLPGMLVLGGGGDLGASCKAVAAEVLASSKAKEAVVVPTAAAFEHFDRAGEQAGAFFEALGAQSRVLGVLRREGAEDPGTVEVVRSAKLIVVTDGSPLHLRSVLKGSALIDAMVEARARGAAIWASGAGATVLCDPMVDPRGGAYTVGLGLVGGLAVFPHHDTAPAHLWERSVELRPEGAVLAGLDEGTALVRDPRGAWRVAGSGAVTLLGGPTGTETYEADSSIVTLTM